MIDIIMGLTLHCRFSFLLSGTVSWVVRLCWDRIVLVCSAWGSPARKGGEVGWEFFVCIVNIVVGSQSFSPGTVLSLGLVLWGGLRELGQGL